VTDPDATIRRAPPPAPARPAGPPPARPHGNGWAGRFVPLLAAAALLVAAGLAGWLWLRPEPAPILAEPPPKPEPPALARPAPPEVAPQPARLPRLASEEAILAHRAAAPTLFRLAENPRVFVADFPGLASQGAAFNRAAALIEKAGLPRERVLDDAALAAAIARGGDTAETYYYGHNYRGRDLERFFTLAARDGITLTAEEEWLREQLGHIRALVGPGEEFAVVSVPGLEPRVDEAMRRAILHHEIGHGHFFTNPAFAAHVAEVWREVFTEEERARFRAFLEREGYDAALEEVMMNEAMAYLLYTPDPRFFTPAHAGLDEARAEALRRALRARAPR
jgi:hypothetical protein